MPPLVPRFPQIFAELVDLLPQVVECEVDFLGRDPEGHDGGPGDPDEGEEGDGEGDEADDGGGGREGGHRGGHSGSWQQGMKG